MGTITQYKVKNADGTYTGYEFEVNADNVNIDSSTTLSDKVSVWDNQAGISYGISSTLADSVIKTVATEKNNFKLETGGSVVVKFTNGNTASNISLDVDDTDAKPIYYNGSAINNSAIKENGVYLFTYNGTQFDLIGNIDSGSAEVPIATIQNLGIVKPDGKSINIDNVGTVSVNEFIGTAAEIKEILADIPDGATVYITDDGGDTPTPSITKVDKPTVTVETYTYNGSAQGPIITGIDTEHTIVTNETKINAGTYTLTIALKNNSTMVWEDGTTADLIYEYTINKAQGELNLSPSEIILRPGASVTSLISSVGDGQITVVNNNISMYEMNYNSDNSTITINNSAGEDKDIGTVTVTLSDGLNYAGAVATLKVNIENGSGLVAWSSGSDAQIKEMIDGYYNGTFSLEDIQSVWSVGDVRNVTVDAMPATGVGESHRSQVVQMQIIDFDHDLLVTPQNDGNIIKALITVQTKDCLRDKDVADNNGRNNTENGYMNSTNITTDGWYGCARRAWCNSVFYNALPSGFKSMVKQVKKSTDNGVPSSPTWWVTHDYCFLISEFELLGHKTWSNENGEDAAHIDKDDNNTNITMPKGGSWYDYYTVEANQIKMPGWSSSSLWGEYYLRSPEKSYGDSFIVACYGYSDRVATTQSSYPREIAPACCL